MSSFLNDHPFAVEAFFERSLVLTFAVTKEQLGPLIPGCLKLDCFQDKWAFLAIALVQTRNLRPKGFPEFLGQDFFLIGYRLFVQYTNQEQKRLRGLYILKSETDQKKMEYLGNLFTHYRYSTTDIQSRENQEIWTLSSLKSRFSLTVDLSSNPVDLPEHSPFADWKEAGRFAGPLPFTFYCDELRRKILIVEGVRQHWKPAPVKVLNYQFDFIQSLGLQNPVLANAFVIKQIPYYWKKGKVEPWR